jgi:hypothetical protein
MALLEDREKANTAELAPSKAELEADRERELPKTVTTIPTDILRAELARRAKADDLVALYRPVPLSADDLKIIKEDTTEFHAPIRAQIMRAEAEQDTERLIRLQRQLLAMIQNDQSAARRAELQRRAAEIIASAPD